MNKGDFTAGRGKRPPVTDKVDMSLDDIIRLNRKEKQFKGRRANVSRRPFVKKGRLNPVSQKTAGQRGGGVATLRNRRFPPAVNRRRGQGVRTGLAARRTPVLLRRTGTLNRPAGNQVRPVGNWIRPSENQKTRQRTRPFTPHIETQSRRPEVQRQLYRQPDPIRGQNGTSARRPFQLRRRPPPTVQQTQRDARQATFLFRRGLKVQAQVQKQSPRPPVRSRQWRTPTAPTGILTVSIDNPTARTQPEPPTAWTLHPPAPSAVPVKMETTEKKIPKGVPLQFDINSVGKPQTSMTLNERFRILKDRRAATAQSSKGSRFVTVG